MQKVAHIHFAKKENLTSEPHKQCLKKHIIIEIYNLIISYYI